MKFMKMIFVTVLMPLFLFAACSATGAVEEEPPFEPEPQEQVVPAEPIETAVPPEEDEQESEPATAVPATHTPTPLDEEDANQQTLDAVKSFNETREASGGSDARTDPEEMVTAAATGDTNQAIDEDDNVNSAKEDLAVKLSIPVAEIDVVRYEQVMWRDGSLGCPDPKASYIQVVQEGYRIQLSANGQVYDYHGAQGKLPFLCER